MASSAVTRVTRVTPCCTHYTRFISGPQDRIGSTGNQFAISTLLGTLAILPFWLATEAKNFGTFVELFKTVRPRNGRNEHCYSRRYAGVTAARALLERALLSRSHAGAVPDRTQRSRCANPRHASPRRLYS